MRHCVQILSGARVRSRPLLTLGLVSALILTLPLSAADPKNGRPARTQFLQLQKPMAAQAPLAPRSALLTVEDWQKAPLTPIQPGEIDRLVAKELQASKIAPAPRTTDEQFIRRATLDLTGHLPRVEEVEAFVRSPDPHKRAALIDRLLDSDAYASHWASYWHAVVTERSTDRRAVVLARSFEEWLREQLKSNQPWDKIARAMITAEGPCRFDGKDNNGAAFFLVSHIGKDAANEQAAETSRVFLGIQIQCAQCHDHPSDQWKRVQFHELAGYFARLRARPVRDGKRMVGFELVSAFRGEHEMPGKEDPQKGLVTPPRFLNGHSPGNNLSDKERRQALAREVTAKDNYWFAAAYVNRIWGVLMGQAFYQPVDDLGPQKEAVFPAVLTRLTGSFRGTDYDMKRLLRDVMNSETYQRQIRLSDGAEEHLHFAAAYPTRLSADALWQSLVGVLGDLNPAFLAARPAGPYGFRPGFEFFFKQEFAFEPSTKPDDVEGSVAQALLLMNNPLINNRIEAQAGSVLGKILKEYPNDDDALRGLYLRTLARKPTDQELKKCRSYIQQAGSRAEGFEDVLWALVNSTEFQTKR